ncbi:hypothetical protein [Burkholderia anthina]|uniref:hypothetical protein n=1 Tax=Burkholderia anthina TaxID=179879 RepID=UPI0012DAD06D|nr:hypothetical protein [Burkholderia anthina]
MLRASSARAIAVMNAVSADIARTLRAARDACFGAAAVWPLVERAYGELRRFDHTLAHLAELFAHLAPYRTEPPWPAIELAAWAHDVVYATTLQDDADNEARSARAGREHALYRVMVARARIASVHGPRSRAGHAVAPAARNVRRRSAMAARGADRRTPPPHRDDHDHVWSARHRRGVTPVKRVKVREKWL